MLKKKKKNGVAIVLGFLLLAGLSWLQAESSGVKKDYGIKSSKLAAVNFKDDFWQKRIDTDIKVTISHVFKQIEQTGRLKNFELASPQGQGDFCSNYPFDDSDVYKTIEAASYSLMLHPDPELVKYLDKVISKIAAAQEKDGYIYTARAIKDKGGKIP